MFKRKPVSTPEHNITTASPLDLHLMTVGNLQTQVNRRDFLIIGLALACAVSVYSWKSATDRLIDNVKFLYVKLAPSGETFVTENSSQQPEYFPATIDHFLKQAADWRLTKDKRIEYLYGGFSEFLSSAQRTIFLNEFKAYDRASTFLTCGNCADVQAEYVSHTHLDMLDLSPRNAKTKNNEYTSLFFYNLKTRSKVGELMNTERVIMRIRWRLKNMNEIRADVKHIKDNPIGLEIVSYEIKQDPAFKANPNESAGEIK
jgi:hypothetical protein